MRELVLRHVAVVSLLTLPSISRSNAHAPASKSVTAFVALRSGMERLPPGQHDVEQSDSLSVCATSQRLRGTSNPTRS